MQSPKCDGSSQGWLVVGKFTHNVKFTYVLEILKSSGVESRSLPWLPCVLTIRPARLALFDICCKLHEVSSPVAKKDLLEEKGPLL